MSDLYLTQARETAASRLRKISEDLREADERFGDRTCVYATGSFGRLEAGRNSDLDLFIVVLPKSVDTEEPSLNAVDEIKLKSVLIDVVESNSIAKFDGGGKFLTSHTKDSFTKWLGSSEDDYRNTLTGRMLLLLESKPLIGKDIYNDVICSVTDKYFRDYPSHEENFLPAFLFNDIIRMWRTFCVNYEFKRNPEDSRTKIKNLKLKFSRMLTCYSAIIYLLALHAKHRTVRPDDIIEMVGISPTERLAALGEERLKISDHISDCLKADAYSALTLYSQFLELTHKEIRSAAREYQADEEAWKSKSYQFGQFLSELIDRLGGTSDHAAALRRIVSI